MKEHAPTYFALMAGMLWTILLWLRRATGISYVRNRLDCEAWRKELERREADVDERLRRIVRDLRRLLG